MPRRTGVEPNSGTESRRSRVAIGVLLLLLLALQLRLWSGQASWAEVAELTDRLELRRAEIAQLQSQNAALEAEVRMLKAGPGSMEARARNELGMIRRGETFFLVVPQGPALSAAVGAAVGAAHE